MVARARAWIREHPRLTVAAYAAVFAAVAFSLTRPVLLVNDGHMYFEMARNMRHGTLEVYNGLDLVDSPELWIRNAVERGAHLYAKYPPLYGVLAAVPYALCGVRGLYLSNAIGFVVAVLAIHELARRLLGPSRALSATLLLPFAVPLVPYMLMELPHLVALAPLLWAIALWDDAVGASDPRRAAGRALAAGLLAGLACGVRVQDYVVTAPLFVVAFFHARHRGRTVGALAAGLAACTLAVAAFNVQRFGSFNPFSYGPAHAALGSPIPEETAGFFLRPAIAADFAVVLGVLLASRLCRRASSAWLLAAGGAAVIAAVPAMREVALRMGASTASVILNASIAGTGWSVPDTTHGWIDKALLSSTPFLVLGLLALGPSIARRAPPLQTALAWMAVALLLFLSVRDPDPRSLRSVMGFMSLSPRYLLEVIPGLYLLAWQALRAVRFRPAHLVTGLGVGLALFAFMWTTGRDDLSPAKIDLLATDSIAAAALLLFAYRARRERAGAAVLGVLVAVTHAYAGACIFAEDSRCFLETAAVHDRWGQRILAAMPEPKLAVVGWQFAKDAIFHVRAVKPIIIVDPYVDDAASLQPTLDALVAGGIQPYYFGLELERVRPHIEARYRAVPVLDDPLLWRLDPK